MKKLWFVVLSFLVCCSGLWAQEINLPEAECKGLTILSEKASTKNGLTLQMKCGIDKLYFYDVETPKGGFTVLYTPEFYFGGEFGAPQLPVIHKLVQIPIDGKVSVKVNKYDSKEIKLADHGIDRKIFPRQPSAPKDGSEVPFIYEKSAYIYKGFHGQPLVSIKEIGIMRHMRLAHLTVAPISYNAVENKIMVCNNIEFEIIMDGSINKTRSVQEKYWAPAFAWMDAMVISPKALKFSKKGAAEGYVIVSDPAFKSEITQFAEWKAKKGFKVHVVYTDQFGSGAAITEPLKDYLHKLYKNPSEELPPPSYILFVGDHDNLPAFKGKTGNHITDLYYVTVTPGDFLPEMISGRFSARNLDELKPQIEKTLEYEKQQFPDPSFLKNAVLIAGWDSTWARSHGWPHVNYATKYYFNKENGFENVGAFLSSGPQQNVATIISLVAKGASFVNYTAHGSATSWADPSFTISNIQNLGNKGKYPFVVGNCCVTNKFEVGTCFGEAWLRAKDCGAIGYVGGTNNTYWDEDIWWGIGLHAIVKPNPQGIPPLKENTGRGALDSLFEPGGISNGAFLNVGNLAVEASSSTRKQYYWEVYLLMGDPSLKTFMGQLQN